MPPVDPHHGRSPRPTSRPATDPDYVPFRPVPRPTDDDLCRLPAADRDRRRQPLAAPDRDHRRRPSAYPSVPATASFWPAPPVTPCSACRPPDTRPLDVVAAPHDRPLRRCPCATVQKCSEASRVVDDVCGIDSSPSHPSDFVINFRYNF
ncbi:proline-rich receptor-like protein kinase PERK9 [Iris pallida]|uniref:Proline-rich receptor-like protein kinase PERK9 n=1 Tax=Iris pallida TaxID=29817 RepID=A0AAX6GGC2_IRIPA|nr:proline-rich receptor-like protein kinase PERK9 [Iris pallida]